jgi:hypothetical protein
MQAVVGGNIRYPNLQSIASLFRTSINDDFNNQGGSGTGYGGGAGLIMPNVNPALITFLDSATRELFSDLRNVGDPELILDNYILTGLPPVNSWLGPGVVNPATQVSIAYSGYFDGVQWYSDWVLPISTSKVLFLWERQTNTNTNFVPMRQAPFGLAGIQQNIRQGQWEMRQSQIWMPGSIQLTDIRMRVRITYPDYLNPATIDYTTAYVPILDSRNAIVSKMLIRYAMRFAPENYQMAIAEEKRLMDKLKLEVVRQMQSQENQRAEWGVQATQDFQSSWNWV